MAGGPFNPKRRGAAEKPPIILTRIVQTIADGFVDELGIKARELTVSKINDAYQIKMLDPWGLEGLKIIVSVCAENDRPTFYLDHIDQDYEMGWSESRPCESMSKIIFCMGRIQVKAANRRGKQ